MRSQVKGSPNYILLQTSLLWVTLKSPTPGFLLPCYWLCILGGNNVAMFKTSTMFGSNPTKKTCSSSSLLVTHKHSVYVSVFDHYPRTNTHSLVHTSCLGTSSIIFLSHTHTHTHILLTFTSLITTDTQTHSLVRTQPVYVQVWLPVAHTSWTHTHTHTILISHTCTHPVYIHVWSSHSLHLSHSHTLVDPSHPTQSDFNPLTFIP